MKIANGKKPSHFKVILLLVITEIRVVCTSDKYSSKAISPNTLDRELFSEGDMLRISENFILMMLIFI